MIERKSDMNIKHMRVSGAIVGDTLRMVRGMISEGVQLKELDRAAESFIRSRGATPTFKGYHGFPASLCLSLNHEVVHGIPNNRKLKNGDILAIDCGATLNGWVGDAAITVACGSISAELQDLIDTTRASMLAGIEAAKVGNRLGDVGSAIEGVINKKGYGIVREYCGHGVGHRLHEDPQVPNYGKAGTGPRILAGWCLALEPMVNLGGDDVYTLSDGWTVVTSDGKPSAHCEHSIAITQTGTEILTLTTLGEHP